MASENPNDAVEVESSAEGEQTPVEPRPAEPRPVEPRPVEPRPVEPRPVESSSADPTPSTATEASEEPGAEPPRDAKESKRHRFESMLPNLIRRGIEKGIEAGLNTFEKSVETGRETSGAVREAFQEVKIPRDMASAVGKALSEAKLPREIASAVFGQLDETKNDVLRIVAREVREFLQATDLAGEMKKALTSLSFEVRTEVRFIPNDAGDGVKPDVRARTRIKRDRTPSPRERTLRRGKVRAKPAESEEDDEGEE